MDWKYGTTPRLAAKVLGVRGMLLEDTESVENRWIREFKEAGFGKGPLTGCFEEHFEEQRREARDDLYHLELEYPGIEPDTTGLMAEGFLSKSFSSQPKLSTFSSTSRHISTFEVLSFPDLRSE